MTDEKTIHLSYKMSFTMKAMPFILPLFMILAMCFMVYRPDIARPNVGEVWSKAYDGDPWGDSSINARSIKILERKDGWIRFTYLDVGGESTLDTLTIITVYSKLKDAEEVKNPIIPIPDPEAESEPDDEV